MKKRVWAEAFPPLFLAAAVMITLAAMVYGFSYARIESPAAEGAKDNAAISDDEEGSEEETALSGDAEGEGGVRCAYLMADPGQTGDMVFGSQVKREEITSIQLVNHCTVFGMNAWDVSEKGDMSILAWIEREGTGIVEAVDSAGLWAKEETGEEVTLYLATAADYIVPESCTALFAGYTNVEEIAFNGCFLPQGGDMSFLFGECPSLERLDLSEPFTTAGATGLKAMFYQCTSLKELDLSGWETGQVTDMSFLFYQCASLTGLDLSGWDTGRVKNMYAMFYGCSALETLDVSGFTTRRVRDMKHMFEGCLSLKALDVSSFRISSDTDIRHMFKNCSGLTSLVLDGFAYEQALKQEGMFDSCGVIPSA